MISRANSAMSAGSSGSKAEYQSPLAATWRITSRAASIRSSMAPRLARGPEALRADRARIHAELEQQLARGLDEAVRAAHEREPRPLGRRAQELGVDVAGVPRPAVGRLAGVGERGRVADLVLVDHVVRV